MLLNNFNILIIMQRSKITESLYIEENTVYRINIYMYSQATKKRKKEGKQSKVRETQQLHNDFNWILTKENNNVKLEYKNIENSLQ